jgi:hypothetical protein
VIADEPRLGIIREALVRLCQLSQPIVIALIRVPPAWRLLTGRLEWRPRRPLPAAGPKCSDPFDDGARPVLVAPNASVPRHAVIATSRRLLRTLELSAASFCLLLALACLFLLVIVSLMTGVQYDTWRDSYKLAVKTLVFGFSFVCLYFALTFAEGRKYTALYLRRFRSDVNLLVATAIERGLGRRVRIVTLDDERFMPIEVPRLEKWSSRLLPALMLIGAAVLAVLVIRTFIASLSLRYEGLQQQYTQEAVLMLGFWTWHLWCLLFMLLGHRLWIRLQARVRVRTAWGLAKARYFSWKLRRWCNRSGLMAPQATVVTVRDDLWQVAVTQLIAQVDAVLVDVSEPSDALAWELEQLKQSSSPPAVFVAETARFHAWTDAALQAESELSCRQLVLHTLRNKTVVLYSATDKRTSALFRRNVANTLRTAVLERGHVVSTAAQIKGQRMLRLLGNAAYYGFVALAAALTGNLLRAQVEASLWRWYFG